MSSSNLAVDFDCILVNIMSHLCMISILLILARSDMTRLH